MVNSFVVTKALIVNKDGLVLTIRRSKTDDRRPLEWDFPGGWLEGDEEPGQAVVREVKEEIGADIDRPRLIYGSSEMTEHGDGTWLFFVIHVDDIPNITLSYEHDMHKWARPEDLLKEIKYHRQVNMLRYVVDNKLLEA